MSCRHSRRQPEAEPKRDCLCTTFGSPFFGISISLIIRTISRARIRCRGCGCMPRGIIGAWPSCFARCPSSRRRINLVPSLLVQLRQYTEEAHEDAHLRVSRLPADGLSADDMIYLLDNFFMVHPDHNIRPHPRYNELYEKRGWRSIRRIGRPSGSRSAIFSICNAGRISVWMHPLAFELDPELAAFRAKGQHWTEADKQWLLAKQMELLREVIPLHKELADRGQIELSTTPFYHPILPLLWDKRLARQAMPGVALPRASRADAGERHRADSAGGRLSRKAVRQQAARHVALGRLGRASRSFRRSPRPVSNGSQPTKRFCRIRPMVGSRATRKGFCGIPRCSIDRGGSRRKGSVADRLSRPCDERSNRL